MPFYLKNAYCRRESKSQLHSRVQLFVTPWTVAHQAPLSKEFSGQEHWSGLPFPSPGDFPNPGIKTGSPALQADSLPTEPPGKPLVGEGPGETPSAVRCLSHLISRFLTEIKRLAKN